MSRTSLVAVALVAAAVGCGQDAIGPVTSAVDSSRTVSVFVSLGPTNAEGTVGSAVPFEPTVLVIDGAGHPAANVAVHFALVSDEPGAQVGSISRGYALTNAAGMATAGEWTLSTKAGPNFLKATIAGAGALLFSANARPDQAVSLAWSHTEDETAVAGTAVQPPVVQVRDRFGNSIAGVEVTFAITAGGGTLEGAQMVTTDNGAAALAWTLGPNLSANTIMASAAGLQSIEFTVQAWATSTSHRRRW